MVRTCQVRNGLWDYRDRDTGGCWEMAVWLKLRDKEGRCELWGWRGQKARQAWPPKSL